MRFTHFRNSICSAALIFFALLCPTGLLAQSGSGSVHGQVTDPSGAAVPNAIVDVTTTSGQGATSRTGRDGGYEVKGLSPGNYTVKVNADGFETFASPPVAVAPGQSQKVDIPLTIAVQQQSVEVNDNPVTLSVSPDQNAGAIVLSGKDLDALSDDPDQLQSDLEALAGPSIGPNGGQMYIDGFTAGQLPPKSSIREIRINQNPFSAEYDKLGYGRIEILTKPGTDQFHGQFSVMGNDAAFNSRNPFLGSAALPGYDTVQYNGNVGGPLSKKASFFFDFQRRNINDVDVVNAQVLDSNLNIVPNFTQAVPNPRTRTNIDPRLDYQVTPNNTLSVRYQYYRDNVMNDGVGEYSLASQAYNVLTTEHTVQMTDTQVFGGKIVNETHFQYLRDNSNVAPQNTTPTMSVPDSFTGGGNNNGKTIDAQNHYELQNYTSMTLGKHSLKFGVRLRDLQDTNYSVNDFNGTYIFGSLAAYQATEQALKLGMPPPTGTNGPLQFSLITGQPSSSVNLFDAGPYIQDDYRWRPNVTLSAGLRAESQGHISDHLDWAPRLAIAWGIARGKSATPKTVVRAGWGIFYDRFSYNLVLQAERQNGVTQQEYIVPFPTFYPAIPSPAALQSLSTGVPAIYQIAPRLHAPTTMESVISVERQISKTMNGTVTYVHAFGTHQLLANNINAPRIDLDGVLTPVPVSSGGIYPNGVPENIYQYESEGIFRQNQLMANFNVRASANLTLNGYYSLSYANSDTSGATTFPTNPYNVGADYGRAGFDVRSRAFFGGTIVAPYGIRLNPFMVLASGAPFNVTTGTDLDGDSIFNDRPAFVSATACPTLTTVSPNIECTPLGTFNSSPAPGQKTIPVNAYTGPGQFTFNLRVSRTFGFGPRAEGTAGPRPGGGGGRGGAGRRRTRRWHRPGPGRRRSVRRWRTPQQRQPAL
jgi:hypothetical protein